MEPDPPRTPPPPPPPDAAFEDEVVEAPPEPLPRREIWPWLLALLIVVLTGLVVLWLVTRADDEEESATGVIVPAVVGERGPTATARLRAAGFEVRTQRAPSDRPRGVVVAQAPQADTRAPGGALVTLTLSAGAETVTVPRVIGASASAAMQVLRAAGLEPREVRVFADAAPGTVVSQRPAAGAEARPGAEVVLRVSRGGRTVTVPSVVGQTAPDARAALAEVGLGATVVRIPDDEPRGTVVAQSPPAGRTVARGSRVRLDVSAGRAAGTGTAGGEPPPATPPVATARVPAVVGRNQLDAQRTLRAAGFVPRTTYVASTEPRGTVVRQRPSAGASARRGAEVRLDVSSGPTPAAATEVPDVVGVDETTAVTELEDAGFEVAVVEEPTDDPNADGVVIDQDPEAGSRAPAGAQVVITVGRLSE